MKKTFLKLLLLTTFMFLPKLVFAENMNVAEVNNKGYATIEEAMTAAEGTDYEVKLLHDVTLTQTKIVNKDLTINLNGYVIYKDNSLFEVQGAKFTVTGTGELKETSPSYAPIIVKGTADKTPNYTIVNVGENVTLTGWTGIFLRNINQDGKYYVNGVVLNIDGQLNGVNEGESRGAGIYVNGNAKSTENAPIINLNKTSKITATGTGLFAAGYAEWNINGATIIGEGSAIGTKNGKFTINNATLTATGVDITPQYGTGSSIKNTGAAIQIESHSGYGQVSMTIKNSIITSKQGYAFYEYLANYDNVVTNGTKVTNMEIENTTFVSAGEKEKFLVSEDYRNIYSKTIKVNKITNGEIKVDKTEALIGEQVTVSVVVKDGYELKELSIINGSGETINTIDNTFTMPNSNIEISAEFIKIATTTVIPTLNTNNEVSTILVGIKENSNVQDILLNSLKNNKKLAEIAKEKAINIDVEIGNIDSSKIDNKIVEAMKAKAGNAKITDYFDITIAVKETASNKRIDVLSDLTEEIELMILLPENLKNNNDKINRKYYVVREHNGKLDLLDANISEDGKYLMFKSANFSTYALAYEDNVKTNPQTGDNVFMNIMFTGLAMISFFGTVYYIKNKKLFN